MYTYFEVNAVADGNVVGIATAVTTGSAMKERQVGNLIPGVPFALASAVLFGATPPLAKLLLGSVDPVLLAGLMYLGAGVGLSAFIAARKSAGVAGTEAPLARADISWLAAAIAMGGVVGPLFLMFGLAGTEASSASLLLNLESLATMAIAWVVFRENVDRRLLLGAMAILAGAVLLSWQGGGVAIDTGALLVAGACLAWGIDNNLTRKISAADPLVIVAWKGLVAGAVNTSIAFAQGTAAPGLVMALACGALGFFGIGVSLVFFILALRHLGTARTGAYYSLAPFIGAVLAILILAEPVTIRLILAAILMGIGLWLHLAERHEHMHSHAATEHEHSHIHDEHHQHEHDGPVTEPHSHWHRHRPMRHRHVHFPDLHHRHRH
jgi:drug/metabolite transporter (DMT)-like permease